MKSQGRCEVGGYEIGVGHRFHACQKLETFDLATDAFEPPLHALGSACPPPPHVPPTHTHIRCGIPACARTNHPLMTALSAPAPCPHPVRSVPRRRAFEPGWRPCRGGAPQWAASRAPTRAPRSRIIMGDDMSLLTVLRLTSVPHTSCVLMIMVGRAALMSESAGRRIPVSQRPSQMGGDVMSCKSR